MSSEPPDARPTPPRYPSVVRRRGDRAPIVVGRDRSPFTDVYHRMLALPLLGILALMGATFLVLNLIFAGLYVADPGGIAAMTPGDFWSAFFFSVETFGTIGYGHWYPVSVHANLVMTVETFVGLVYVAVTTGLVFARVSRPVSRVTFSQVAVIHDFEGTSTLMFRAANRRSNNILEAEVMVSLARDAETSEGIQFRRFEELRVARSRTPLFALTWTILHPIDGASPLKEATPQSLSAAHAEIIVVLSGTDDRYAQRVHARHSYDASEVLWDKRFADILSFGEGGRRKVDYGRFHDVVDL
ncbi:MAG TPA: ion channel [Caulobacteraceae bacterium]